MPTRPFEVYMISESGKTIKTHIGTKVTPDYSINDSPTFDILLVPGGPLRAIQSISKNKKIIEWIKSQKSIEYICSVSTGAYLLGEACLLAGKKVTTHHLALKLLQDKYPDTHGISQEKVVHDVNIISCGGVSSGINMGLYLVEQLLGDSLQKELLERLNLQDEHFNKYIDFNSIFIVNRSILYIQERKE